jgi:hypothetical protein
MSHEPIIEELHRHREELFKEFGNDPEALVRYLQQKESESGRQVKAPEQPPPDQRLQRARFARR